MADDRVSPFDNEDNATQILQGLISPVPAQALVAPPHPAVNQALATDAMPTYRSRLRSAIGNIYGSKLVASRDAKNPERLAEKIEREEQPAETVSDYGAAQITVDSPQTRDAVVVAVRKQFPVLREQDNFDRGDPEYGYRSYSMQLQMPSGVSQELQIVPKEVFEINSAEHEDYKAARDAELSGDDASEMKLAARALNDAAMAKFNLRNASPRLKKGMAVTLSDGTAATISYLDPHMKIARVRLANGKSQTVRLSQLKSDQKKSE